MAEPDWIQFLPADAQPLADRIPVPLRRWIDADIGRILTPSAIERFTPAMADWPAQRIWKALFQPTAFHAIRMEAEVGPVCAVSSPKHPRFPYFTYVPMAAQIKCVETAPLIVTVHGSERNAYASRDRFAAFAEARGCFVIAPLFPMDMSDANPDEQYKYVFTDKQRFDVVVLDLIEEFSTLVGVKFDPILLHGYSGGGQFVHRFLYQHADKVAAASIGAPGYVTLPDATAPWWVGLAGFERLTGTAPDLEALARVRLHLMIGELDDYDIDYYAPEEIGLNASEYADYGRTRRARLDRLHEAYRRLGLDVTYDIVPAMAHGTNVEPALKFFASVLDQGPRADG